MTIIDFRSTKQMSYVYVHDQAIRHNWNVEFEGFFELKHCTSSRKLFPRRLKLEKTDKYTKFHAFYALSGKYCNPDRYFFISALRRVLYRKTVIYYGDFRPKDTQINSFFIAETINYQFLIIHYFHEYMPSRCADFASSMMESVRIKEIRKKLFNQFNISSHD